MPIYEYYCRDCRTKVSVFFRSYAAVSDPSCPRCGGEHLERLFSRVVVRRGGSRGDALPPDGDLDGLEGEDFDDDRYGDDFGADPFGLGEDADPQEIARWTREMSTQMGEPLDPDLDAALTDLERGADPDEVLHRLDETPPPETKD